MNQEKNKRDPRLFPLDSLPSYLEDYIEHLNSVMEYDYNTQAMASIIHAASLLDSRITSTYKGKTQRPIIWGLVAQRTGTGKSNLLDTHTEFLHNKDIENSQPDIVYQCDEATYEAVLKYSIDNTRGILYTVDEFEVLIQGMDNYSKGNKGRFMSLWNPKTAKLLRAGQTPIPIPWHKVNFLAFTQPKSLASLLSSKDFYSGYAKRFLFCEQYDKSFRFENDNILNPKYTEPMNKFYERIWSIKPTHFVFSEESRKYFMDWYNAEARKHMNYPILLDYIPKLNTYGIRLAVVIHALEFAHSGSKQPSKEIPISITKRVTEILEFFVEQYKVMLENRYQDYDQDILNEQSEAFRKCYRTLSEEKHYRHTDLKEHFKNVYRSPTTINSRIKNTTLFKHSGNVYYKAIHNE